MHLSGEAKMKELPVANKWWMKRHGEKFSARLSKQVYLEGKVTQNHNEVKWDTVNTILKNKYAL